MKLFNKMTKEEAKEMYEKIKNEKFDPAVKKILLDDIYFFTNNFTQDY